MLQNTSGRLLLFIPLFVHLFLSFINNKKKGNSLKSGPETRDPGPGTLRPGTLGSRTWDLVPWDLETQDFETRDPGIQETGHKTLGPETLGPWDLGRAILGHGTLAPGILEIGLWDHGTSNWPLRQIFLTLFVKQILIIKS